MNEKNLIIMTKSRLFVNKIVPSPHVCTKFKKKKYSYGAVDGIAGPTTKAFWAPPFWGSLESPGPVIYEKKRNNMLDENNQFLLMTGE